MFRGGFFEGGVSAGIPERGQKVSFVRVLHEVPQRLAAVLPQAVTCWRKDNSLILPMMDVF